MNLMLLGAPGAGKGTQAERLAAEFGVPHISTGDILRAAVAQGTAMGRKAQEYMDAGRLVPDEVVIGIVRDRLGDADAESGFVLDGFPRTVAQAEALDRELAAMEKNLDVVVNIAVSEEVIVRRLSGRRSCGSCGHVCNVESDPAAAERCGVCGGELVIRADDRPETIKKRFDVYREQTAPLVRYYRERDALLDIDGSQDPDEVFENIEKAARARVEAGRK